MPRGHIEKKPHAYSQPLASFGQFNILHDHDEANSLTGTTRISSHWLNSVFIATQTRTDRRHSLSFTCGSSGTNANQTISRESSIAKRQPFPKVVASANYVANRRASYQDAMNESSSRQPTAKAHVMVQSRTTPLHKPRIKYRRHLRYLRVQYRHRPALMPPYVAISAISVRIHSCSCSSRCVTQPSVHLQF